MVTQIKLRRDTAANWTLNGSVVLAAGEPGFETDTGRLKIGNGNDDWSTLSYVSGSGSGDRLTNGLNEVVLGSDGKLTLPQGTTLGERTWTSAISAVTTGASTYITLTDDEFNYPETGQVTISGVEGATNLNRTWYYQAEDGNALQLFYFEDRVATVDSTGWDAWTTDTGTVTLVTETELTVNGNKWKFSKDGSTSLPPGGQLAFNENNNSYIAAGGTFPWHNGGLNLVSGNQNAVTITSIDTSVPNNTKFNSWTFNNDGTLQLPNYVKQRDTGNVVCNAGVDTVIYTGSAYIHTFKILIKVEGYEVNGATGWDTQSTEMIIAKSFNGDKVAASAYGVVHTSTDPLATFTARWNAVSGRVEVLCRPTSLTYGVEVRTFATEITTSD